ncbi:MAG TPA: sigma-70 family RNA polymerase sigma factor [Thermoanaerobaculia bacterium]|nr:sigma-70 family RNA polymerase sigma factor [Thermoanaerobaculia bacterium]
MDDAAIQDQVRRALAGEEPALTQLVQTLTPVIQSRVARGLLLRRTGRASGRNIRQEVEDLTQEIFLALFADGGKALRSWQPERGLSLLNFVGLVAERQTASILRSGKRSPWKEESPLPEDFNQPAPERGPEEITASREQVKLLLHRLTEELSPLGRHLFDLLFLRELPFEEVTRQTGMTPDAVYAWRSRLRRLACRLLSEKSESRPAPRRPSRDGRA